jgi:hypothetical protein
MMKKILLAALASAAALTAVGTADARDGCGEGFHRGPYGHCRPNRGPGPVLVRPGVIAPGLAIGTFYPGHGYWDGRRYWGHRDAWHRGWRYH